MMTNPHFDSVQAAQTRRLSAQSVTDDQLLAAFESMPPERAHKLAQRALTSAIRRSMREAHQRPVVAE